jgi:NTE family protein
MGGEEGALHVSRRALKGSWAGSRLELVLGGGGALGAFHPRVYEALHKAGLEPDRLIGSSVGALNGALIAGNPPPARRPRHGGRGAVGHRHPT